MKLFLIRLAKAVSGSGTEKTVSEAGQKKFMSKIKSFKDFSITINYLISSLKLRALQTADLLNGK